MDDKIITIDENSDLSDADWQDITRRLAATRSWSGKPTWQSKDGRVTWTSARLAREEFEQNHRGKP